MTTLVHYANFNDTAAFRDVSVGASITPFNSADSQNVARASRHDAA